MPNQIEIAEKIGISQGQLSRFISGESRGKGTAKKIAESGLVDIKWTDCFEINGVELWERLIDGMESRGRSGSII